MLKLLLPPLAAMALLPSAHAQDGAAGELIGLINQWRAAPAACQGRQRAAVARLAPTAVLSRVALKPGSILLAALDQAGYDPELADAVQVAGPADAPAAFEALRDAYCATLSSTRYQDIGAHRNGNEWTVVLARPTPDPTVLLPGLEEAGRQILDATNAARAAGRQCGERWMPAAPPVAWNGQLAAAALVHSQDMARLSYFSHYDKQGKDVTHRTTQAGYAWRHVAENISRGQVSAAEAVAGWVESPGHCANLMNPRHTDLGAAYAVRGGKRPAAYWTQVFATPR